jgi:hypothetical protein
MQLQLQLIYDRQSVGQSVLVLGAYLGPVTNFSVLEISFRQLRVCNFVAPSLTRGRVYKLLYSCFWALPEQSFFVKVKVTVKVILRLTVSQSVCLGVKFTLELETRYYFLSKSCCVVSVGRPL